MLGEIDPVTFSKMLKADLSYREIYDAERETILIKYIDTYLASVTQQTRLSKTIWK